MTAEQQNLSDGALGIAAASGSSPEACAVAVSSLLGGLAGPRAGIRGPAGELINPRLNLIVAGLESGPWMRAQELVLSPAERCQETLRQISRVLSQERLGVLECNYCERDNTNAIVNADSDVFDTMLGAAGHASDRRKFVALRQPSVMMRSPAPETYADGLREILDGSPLLCYPDGQLFAALRKVKNSTEHIDAVAAALAGTDSLSDKLREAEGFGRLEAFHGSLLMTCTPTQLGDALGSDQAGIQRLLRHCYFIDAPVENTVTGPLDKIQAAYRTYPAAIKSVLEARRAGAGMQFDVSDKEARRLHEFSAELVKMTANLPEPLVPYFRGVLDLHYKLAWGQLACPGCVDTTEGTVEAAMYLAGWVVRRQRQLLSDLIADAEVSEHQQARRTMLAKLQDGPQTFRQLLRRYSNQRRDVHEPVMSELLNEGLIRLGDNGMLELAGKAA